LDDGREALHRGEVGVLQARKDHLELGVAGAFEAVELPELPSEDDELLLDARQLGVRRDPGAVPGKVSFAHRLGPHVSAGWCAISGKSLRVRPKRVHRSRGPNRLVRLAPPGW